MYWVNQCNMPSDTYNILHIHHRLFTSMNKLCLNFTPPIATPPCSLRGGGEFLFVYCGKPFMHLRDVGYCHVVNAEIAVAMTVPIENPAECEVRGVIRFLQADEILGHLTEEANSRVELFYCTTMHVRILPGRHTPCCVSNSIGTTSSILHTVRTWYCLTFSCFQK